MGKPTKTEALKNALKELKGKKNMAFREIYRSPITGERITGKPRRQTKSKNRLTSAVSKEKEKDKNNRETCYQFQNSLSFDDGPEVDTERILDTCLELLHQMKSRKPKRTWTERCKILDDDWNDVREGLWNYLLENEYVQGLCSICHQIDAVIKCFSCCNADICWQCDLHLHKDNLLHDRSAFYDGFLHPLLPTQFIDESLKICTIEKTPLLMQKKCQNCSGTNIEVKPCKEMCIVIDLKGRYDLNKYKNLCLDCGNMDSPFDLANILKSGYWPGSPKVITYLIHENVFKLWDNFRKRMPGSSERAFLLSLEDMSESFSREPSINAASFLAAFREWNYWTHNKNLIQGKNWMKCPPCNEIQHSSHVDGNMKLYRYKSSGSEKRKSLYGELFICSNSKVQSYIDKIYKGSYSKSDISCHGNWIAAKNEMRKKPKLEETGFEVMTCRHNVGQKALNMFRGEIFGYPLYLIKEVMIPNNVTFVFADVACKLWPFAIEKEPEIESKIKPALSVMHAKGHSLDCQILWSGEYVKGTGNSTGEETEQFFSFLSRCGNTTKHQTPENREETLTEMTLGWNKRKILNICNALVKRYKENTVRKTNICEKIKEITDALQLQSRFDECAEVWINEMKNSARGINNFKCRKTLLPCEKILLLTNDLRVKPYVHSLNDFVFPKQVKYTKYYPFLGFDIREKEKEFQRLKSINKELLSTGYLTNAYERIKKEIWAPMYHIDIETLFMEKVIWNVRCKFVAETSSRRRLMRGKQAAVTQKITDYLTEFCLMFPQYTYDELYNSCNEGLFPWRQADSTESQKLTLSQKRLCVDLYMKRSHIDEERKILEREMADTVNFYKQNISKLTEEIQTIVNHNDPSTEVSFLSSFGTKLYDMQGVLALLRQGRDFHCNEKAKANENFSLLSDHPSVPPADVTDEEEDELYESSDDSISSSSDNISPLFDIGIDDVISTGIALVESYSISDLSINTTALGKLVYFPHECCQSRINGSFGSNACVIIALLTGYSFMIAKPSLSFDHVSFFSETFPLLCGAMDIGNGLYDFNEASGNLLIDEAISMLPKIVRVSIMDEQNVYPCHDNEASLASYIQSLPVTLNHHTILVVANEKALCLLVDNDHCVIIDSHMHDDYGGKAVFFDKVRSDKIGEVLQETELLYIAHLNYY